MHVAAAAATQTRTRLIASSSSMYAAAAAIIIIILIVSSTTLCTQSYNRWKKITSTPLKNEIENVFVSMPAHTGLDCLAAK